MCIYYLCKDFTKNIFAALGAKLPVLTSAVHGQHCDAFTQPILSCVNG